MWDDDDDDDDNDSPIPAYLSNATNNTPETTSPSTHTLQGFVVTETNDYLINDSQESSQPQHQESQKSIQSPKNQGTDSGKQSIGKNADEGADDEVLAGDEQVNEADEEDNDVKTVEEINAERKVRRQRPKLDFEFFKPQKKQSDHLDSQFDPDQFEPIDDEKEDKLWTFFLDIVATYPTLEERRTETGIKESRDIMVAHLDTLLMQIRKWSQTNYQCGLSLLEFAEKVEKLSVKSDFRDYRNELLRKYVTTDWKKDAKQRAEKQTEQQSENIQEQFTSNISSSVPLAYEIPEKSQYVNSFSPFNGNEGNEDSMTYLNPTSQSHNFLQHSEGKILNHSTLQKIRQQKDEALARRKAKQKVNETESLPMNRNSSTESCENSTSSTTFQQQSSTISTSEATLLHQPKVILYAEKIEELRRKKQEILLRQQQRLQQNLKSTDVS